MHLIHRFVLGGATRKPARERTNRDLVRGRKAFGILLQELSDTASTQTLLLIPITKSLNYINIQSALPSLQEYATFFDHFIRKS